MFEVFYGAESCANAPERAKEQVQGLLDLLIGIEDNAPHLVIDKADRQRCAQFPTAGFIANAALQPSPDHMELGLRKRSLQTQQETVIELLGIVQPILIQDQRLG